MFSSTLVVCYFGATENLEFSIAIIEIINRDFVELIFMVKSCICIVTVLFTALFVCKLRRFLKTRPTSSLTECVKVSNQLVIYQMAIEILIIIVPTFLTTFLNYIFNLDVKGNLEVLRNGGQNKSKETVTANLQRSCAVPLKGLFVQRTVILLLPFHAAKLHKAITVMVLLFSAVAMSTTFYFHLSSYSVTGQPFPEGCFAFNCVTSLGLTGRTSDFYNRLIGAISMTASGCIFLVTLQKARAKSQSAAAPEDKFSSFTKYYFVLRTVFVLAYFVPDYIMIRTSGKSITRFIGPCIILYGSLDGLLTMLVYFHVIIKHQKRVFVLVTTKA
ncbi:hypothetical protein QR680_010103 [Steinernema hermaphroditum]|uniref:Uncharacterized protein n=1 Tax=Steinernema hermaphroditum TaxID=289476 RepID=A0AA39MA26_9BILA|nr:hypothetical protein QR680_010103 [Steinernema hermaphroditum]